MSTTIRDSDRRADRTRRWSFIGAWLLIFAGCQTVAAPPSNALGPTGAGEPPVALAAVDDDGAGTLTADDQAGGRPLTADEQERLEFSGPVLLNASDDIDPELRRIAARRLLDMNVPQSIAILKQALRSGEAPVITAVVEELSGAASTSSALRDACVDALVSGPPETHRPLAMTLVRFGAEGMDAVCESAFGRERPVEQRVAAISALPAFNSSLAAERLIGLLEAARQESPEIKSAACEALERLTGIPNGNDPVKWRRWWQVAKNQSREQWLTSQVTHLSEQMEVLQAKWREEQRRREQVEQQLYDRLGQLFPMLTIETQLEMLASLLDDDLAVARQFAIERIERLLRDTEPIPDTLQVKLAERLDDEVDELRKQAAELLDELGYERVETLIAGRLATEQNQVVAEGYLRILSRRPDPAAVDAIERWLADPFVAEEASDALWSLAIAPGVDLPESRRRSFAAAIRKARRDPATAETEFALARVLALIGDESDLPALTADLDATEPARRQAVAEGFARRGLVAPLLEHKDDEVIYPFALDAVVAGRTGTAAAEQVIGLTPPERHRRAWLDAVRLSCRELPPGAMLAMDDLLRQEPVAGDLRRELLESLAALPEDRINAEDLSQVLIRLVPLKLERERARRSHELLENLPRAEGTAALRALRFEVAVRSSEFARAAELNAEPMEWIELLEALIERDPDAARAMRDEIEQRFAEQLVGDVKLRFEEATMALPETAPGAAASGGDEAPVRSALEPGP